jgi:hypothetical protein
MQQIDNDISYSRKVGIESLGRGRLTEGIFEDMAQEIRDISQVCGVHTNRVEGAACQIELVAQTYVDVGYLLFLSLSS